MMNMLSAPNMTSMLSAQDLDQMLSHAKVLLPALSNGNTLQVFRAWNSDRTLDKGRESRNNVLLNLIASTTGSHLERRAKSIMFSLSKSLKLTTAGTLKASSMLRNLKALTTRRENR